MKPRSRLADGYSWPYPVDYDREIVPPVPLPQLGGHKPLRFTPKEADEVRAKLAELKSVKAVAHFYKCSTELITHVRDRKAAYSDGEQS